MPSYTAPIDDVMFLLRDVFEIERYNNLPGFSDATPDVIEAVLTEAGRLSEAVLLPLNQSGDRQGCTRHPDGSVTTPDGFKEAYRLYAEGGWGSVSGDTAYGGQGLPQVARHHEPHRAPVRHRPRPAAHASATPQPDGSFHITGQKIFISAGEHDLAPNIVHLVLARIEGAPAGTKGISLFLVPKVLVAADGTLGARNAVSCGSIEHKMGIHGNATCVMNYDGATGWLVGEANRGLNAMFVMMNEARIGVANQGLAMSEVAYQNAAAYAKDRLQGRSLSGRQAGRGGGRPDHRAPGRPPHAAVDPRLQRGGARAAALDRACRPTWPATLGRHARARPRPPRTGSAS